jgi:glutamine amidotransferase
VSSETVLAHVRKATRGPKTVLNCHPFQYGRWVFAHNGDIPNFDSCRDALLDEVDARIRRFILGETDSEVVFFIFLSELLKVKHLTERRTVGEAVTALRGALQRVRAVCDREGAEPASLTVMATDGETMVAAHGGKELFWSSHKTVCGDRATCTSLSPECEAPSRSGRVNHLIISSEPLLGENVWQPMSHGDILGIDWRMHFVHAHTHQRALLPLAQS